MSLYERKFRVKSDEIDDFGARGVQMEDVLAGII